MTGHRTVQRSLPRTFELDRLRSAQREAIEAAQRGHGRDRIRVILSLLMEGKLVRERRGARFVLARDPSDAELVEPAGEWKARAEADREKLERMEAHARSAKCRWRTLHDYFDLAV